VLPENGSERCVGFQKTFEIRDFAVLQNGAADEEIHVFDIDEYLYVSKTVPLKLIHLQVVRY